MRRAAAQALATASIGYTDSAGGCRIAGRQLPATMPTITGWRCRLSALAVTPDRRPGGSIWLSLAMFEPASCCDHRPGYPPTQHHAGAGPRCGRDRPSGRGAPDAARLLAILCAKAAKGVLCQPANPTGATIPADDCANSLRPHGRRPALARHSDEIYHRTELTSRRMSAPCPRTRTSSSSKLVLPAKYTCMTGWRNRLDGAAALAVSRQVPNAPAISLYTLRPGTLTQRAALAAFPRRRRTGGGARPLHGDRTVLMDRLPKLGSAGGTHGRRLLCLLRRRRPQHAAWNSPGRC